MSAYFVVDQREITDPETMKSYTAAVIDTLKLFGGKPIVRGGDFEVVEGDWQPRRMAILEFNDRDSLKGWYNAPEYADLKAMRLASSRSNAIMVDGA